MRTAAPPRSLVALLALLLAAVVALAVIVATTGGEGDDDASPAAASVSGDPSRAYETAADRALPSVVHIQHPGGLGSGVVYDGDDIVTNAHVVAGAQEFVVITPDGKEHEATLRGAFPEGDIAVVRVTGGDLRPARFADSGQLDVGQAVLAIGSPLGLRASVTEGIISATSRTVSEPNGVTLPSVVQTSAPINPGNSGGALVDMTGAVVGIPTVVAVNPDAGGPAPGVGLAISSNSAKRYAAQLVEHGRVVDTGRAWLGVELRPLPTGGALVVAVVRGGPADRAGLRPGDVIVAIDGQPALTVDQIAVALAERKPGERVPVEVRRQDGSKATVEVTLGELPGAR